MKWLSLSLLCSGCIFEDVSDRQLQGAVAFVCVCIGLYAARIIAEHFSSEPEDEDDITAKFRRIS